MKNQSKLCATEYRNGRWVARWRARTGWRDYASQPQFASQMDCYNWIVDNKLGGNAVAGTLAIRERGTNVRA